MSSAVRYSSRKCIFKLTYREGPFPSAYLSTGGHNGHWRAAESCGRGCHTRWAEKYWDVDCWQIHVAIRAEWLLSLRIDIDRCHSCANRDALERNVFSFRCTFETSWLLLPCNHNFLDDYMTKILILNETCTKVCKFSVRTLTFTIHVSWWYLYDYCSIVLLDVLLLHYLGSALSVLL